MSYLKKANDPFRKANYKKAIDYYRLAQEKYPQLSSVIEFNIKKSIEALDKGATYNGLSSNNLNLKTENTAQKINVEKIVNLKLAASQFEGKCELFNEGLLKGWAVKKGHPALIFELVIYVNGKVFSELKNDQSRGDLKRHNKSDGRGGFSILLPKEIFSEDENKIELVLPDKSILAEVFIPKKCNKINLHSNVRVPVDEKVSVIVPIFNAPDDLEVCIKRLLDYTSKEVDIILIDDASTDSKIKNILGSAEKYENVRIFRNESNLGFTRTVNKGIDLAGTNDVVFLNSDARVTPRWLEGLKAALSTDAKIATVTPMSDRAGAFSAPNIGNENDLPEGVREEDYAIAFRRRSFGFYPTVPTGNGFCLYVRRKCIDDIGPLDAEAFPRGYGEENDFCMRARAAGWRNVIDDRTYIFHDRNKSFGEAKTDLMAAGRKIVDKRFPDYKKSTSIFTKSVQINLARFRARMALKDVEAKVLPRGLFVISTLTGGTPQTNRDLMLAVNYEIEPWLLHCDSRVISLYKIHPDRDDELIEQYFLNEQIDPLTHVSAEYDQVIASWMTNFDFELVHIRHLAWHSLNLPKLAKKAGARVIKSFHDYYAVCPTVKLLDNDRKFCGGQCTLTCGECPPELWEKDSFPYLKDNWVHTWRRRFSEAVKHCDAYITTHQSAKNIILEQLDIEAEKFHVIPHGRDFENFYQLSAPFKDGDVLRILVPGNINEAKGSEIIANILTQDKKGLLEFHILGRVSASLNQFKHPRLIIHGEYKREDFAEHVKKIKPHIGAVLSIWNETWCHTLTELWSVGLPVVVTEYQTLSQRVTESGAGWVLESTDLLGAYELFTGIVPRDIVNKRQQILLKTAFEKIANNTNHKMAENYLRVYFDRV